jgi:hypothetical protein
LFFNILVGILAVIGALVLLLAIVVVVIYFILSRNFSRELQPTVGEISEAMSGDSPLEIPPMRIWLEPIDEHVWHGVPLISLIEEWMSSHQFLPGGNYRIQELGGELIRIYLSSDRRLLAAIRLPRDQAEPYVEFCCDLGKGNRGGISNPPSSTIPLPEGAIGKYYSPRLSEDIELLNHMWLQARELVDSQSTVCIDGARVASFFEDAHAAEMDNRLTAGGIDVEEICQAFRAQGLVATELEIQSIQQQWQQAIERHLIACSTRSRDRTNRGAQILAVHDGSLSSYLIARVDVLLRHFQNIDIDELAFLANELVILLGKFRPREAMSRFRPLLPSSLRYQLIDQLTHPVGTDLYLLPNESTAK